MFYCLIEKSNFEVAKLLLRNDTQIDIKSNNLIEYLIKKGETILSKIIIYFE